MEQNKKEKELRFQLETGTELPIDRKANAFLSFLACWRLCTSTMDTMPIN